MPPQNAKAARVAPAASQTALHVDAQDTDCDTRAQAGKALAVWLYNHDLASLAETTARFDRNPCWRSV